ncbi:MAG: hypothetical protein M0D57_03005 [Sphingobacteriales bacterium JAD_PAG50586_3]|nr:MAG: hypothetical protein M0D57_03005 [Sphingobacteriales bacterium JAD_PAG50586_3]
MLKDEGYKQSSSDSNKFINGSDTVKSRGNTTIFNDNTRNSGISNGLFGKKIK